MSACRYVWPGYGIIGIVAYGLFCSSAGSIAGLLMFNANFREWCWESVVKGLAG